MKPKLLFSFYCILLPITTLADLASQQQALVSLRSAVGGRSLLWNVSSPLCNWTGVVCDPRDLVVELRLPGMGLSGQLPAGALGGLTSLQTLSLRYNALSGSIPSDLANITSLRNLYLQENDFSGPIPSFLFSMPNLIRLNLASNNFTGGISPAVNNLTRLKTLFLEENHLSGTIPDITLSLDQFNVSSNQLTGSIPTTLSGLPSSAFEGNSLCGAPLISCNGTGPAGGGKKLSGGAIAGIVIGSLIALFAILFLLVLLCRRKGGKQRDSGAAVVKRGQVEMDVEATAAARDAGTLSSGKGWDVKAIGRTGDKKLVFFGSHQNGYDLEDLLKASAEVLGKGTFGTTYKATLDGGAAVAVKRLKDVIVPEIEFREKMKEIGGLEHENLVGLRGYYYNKDEKLLVYDFMPAGSLSALLHGNAATSRTRLNWDTRANITLGAARAIDHIHSQGNATSHGNIKSSNILLTKTYEARVSDFGLSQLANITAPPNRIDGYRAPEVTDTRKVSQKADVYSFGVLLLELLTGKAPVHSELNEDGVDLPRWVQSVVREEWTGEVFDGELLRYQDVEEEMVQLLQLALDCTVQYPDKRPAMSEVMRRIENLIRAGQHKEPGDIGLSQQTSVDSEAPSTVKE
ncbi:hypothetical protein MLD38_024397 [Melastoma candidum]|uniref:Uncharacterized protein n=1 Tax=Melastoma candidum TaxID=119954 RepID=A0ACB9NTH1_9MYRT|nr:hypothetical protein MLD38_024397 [Melastoma candidum]